MSANAFKNYSWIWLTLLIMWLFKLIEFVFDINLSFLGIAPRKINSILSIITVFFIHGDFAHILSNTFSFLALSILMTYSYPKIAFRIFVLILILTGFLVWLFARGNTYHIGASGVVYGIASFLFFSGFFRKDKLAMVSTLIVALFYGSMVWGILPFQNGISWESHLFGGIVGFYLARHYKDLDKVIINKTWDNDENENDKTFKKFLEDN